MNSIPDIQAALQDAGLDGWFLYDFRGSNILARRVLGMAPDSMGSRRLACLIPATGEPRRLVHRIESDALDHISGSKTIYLKWQEFEAGIETLLSGCRKVATEYSPRNANPYVSRVDAGTIELVRSYGVEVVPSGDLIQLFEATLSDAQWKSHLEASKLTNAAFEMSWAMIADRIRGGGTIEELEISDAIMQHFADNGMTTYHPPIVGVGPNGGNPHYETGQGQRTTIAMGDFVLIDLWAKMDNENGIYSDLTRTGFVGESVPDQYTKIFNIVAAARDAGIAAVRDATSAGRAIQGWEVDDAVRAVIDDAGYGEYFCHRTGHSIGQETHGNGANIDNLETQDQRTLLPRTLFSIEPGIYLPEFGVRSEVDVYIDENRVVHVTGGEIQTAVIPILREF